MKWIKGTTSEGTLFYFRVGDEIVEFGSVNAENFASLQQVAEVVQHSRNQVNTFTYKTGYTSL